MHWARLPAWVAARYTCCATLVEPTKETARTSSWVMRKSTTLGPPVTRLGTPGGRPAPAGGGRQASSTSRTDESGTFSLGLRMNVLPQAMAIGHIQRGTMTGKLKGVIPTQTPRGVRSTVESMPTPDLSSVRQNEDDTAICGRVLPIMSV